MAQFKIVVEEIDEDPEIRILPMGDIVEADNLVADHLVQPRAR